MCIRLASSGRLQIVFQTTWDRVAWWPVAIELAQVPDNGNRVVAIEMFESRVNWYVALRERLEAPLPCFDTHRDDWSLVLTRCYLGSAIRVQEAAGAPGLAPVLQASGAC
jgi:hypothetical protein